MKLLPYIAPSVMLVNVYIVEYVYVIKLCTIKNVFSVMLLSTYHKHTLNANDKHFRHNLRTAPQLCFHIWSYTFHIFFCPQQLDTSSLLMTVFDENLYFLCNLSFSIKVFLDLLDLPYTDHNRESPLYQSMNEI